MKYSLLVLICARAYAQEKLGELMPDRPGFTAPSGVVGFGVLQLEQGYTFESAREDGSGLKTFSGPQTLVRFGLTEALEVRFATGYSRQTLRTGAEIGSAFGPSDSVVSAKFRILEQGALRPELAITGGVSLPARRSAFSSSGRDPLFSLAAYKDLPHGFSVAGNANAASVTDSLGRICSTGESLWAARRFGGTSIFAEVFHTTIGRIEGTETALDVGLFRGIGKNVQIDVEAGHTVAGARPSWFASMGFVFRDPHRLMHHALAGE